MKNNGKKRKFKLHNCGIIVEYFASLKGDDSELNTGIGYAFVFKSFTSAASICAHNGF